MRTKNIIALICWLAFTLSACNVNDPIYDTTHSDHGKITLTTDWTNSTDGVEVPADYTVRVGDYSTTLSGTVNAIDNLFLPGVYRAYIYNAADNITVDGTIAAADYAAGTAGWFFSCAMDAVVEKDTEHHFTAVMQQQVRQLTIALNLTGGAASAVKSIAATLSGVAGTLDIDNDTYDTEAAAPLVFSKDADGLWKATVRLLGVTGDSQKLTGTIKFAGGSPSDMALDSNLTDELAGFNSDKKTPLTLGGKVAETYTPAGFTAIIIDWTIISEDIHVD